MPITQTDNDEWKRIQEKTFTKWVNGKLSKRGYGEIHSLVDGLSDGVVLARLLEILHGDEIDCNPNPRTMIQKMENVENVLRSIRKRIKLVNIRSSDIVDGNYKLTLGLIWSVIKSSSVMDHGSLSMENELLKWCKLVTEGYKNVDIVNFSRSWQDGIAFNAIIHKFRPDLVPNFHELKSSERISNLEQAFHVAEKCFDIPRLLDVEDVADVAVPDEKSIITYVSGYHQTFKSYEEKKSAAQVVKDVVETADWSILSRNTYEIKARRLLSDIKELEKQKEIVFNLVRNLESGLKVLWEVNSTAESGYSEVCALLGSINAIHKAYWMKDYVPPEDVRISELSFTPVWPRDVVGDAELRELYDPSFSSDAESIGEAFEFSKKIFLRTEAIQEQLKDVIKLHERLLAMELNHYAIKAQQERMIDATKRHFYALQKVDIKEKEENIVTEKATAMFEEVHGGKGWISLSDLSLCLDRLGLITKKGLDASISQKDCIYMDDYLSIVKKIYRTPENSSEFRKALRILSGNNDKLDLESLGIQEKNIRSIFHLNGNSMSLDINKFLDSFAKD